MSFENPNFGIEPKPDKSEKDPITGEFLQEQIRLPQNEWDEKFRQLIDEKIRGNKPEESGNESPEVIREQSFKRYLEGLDLDESALKDKKVLDLGSGEGEFVKSLIERGITKEAYGVDVELDGSSIEGNFRNHFFQGSFEEGLPVRDVDYVVSVGAVSLGISAGEEVMNIRRIVEKSLASLKEGGEIRIYPIQEAAMETPLEGLGASRSKWDELLVEISKFFGVEYQIKPRDIKVSGSNNDIILNSVLIIKRKK